VLTFPNVPTDNLYKFIALSGVALFFFAGGFLFVSQKDFFDQRAALRELTGRMEAERENMIARDSYPNMTNLADTADVERHLRALDSLLVAHAGKRGAADVYDMGRKIVMVVCLVMMTAGATIADIGFRLWYKRLQRYQDIIVRAEAKKTKTTG